ncbi:MAG: hypothetical protein ACLUSP_00690 [Christensenellales bacterium]
MFPPKEVDERIIRIGDRIMERYGLRLAKTKNTAEFIRLYADKFLKFSTRHTPKFTERCRLPIK